MIKINLLPQEMAGAKAASAGPSGDGTLLVAVVLLLVLGVNGVLGFYMLSQHATAKDAFDKVAAEKRRVDAELKDTELRYNEQSASIDRMERLISVAEALDPPNRLLWSEKLNMLPLLVPEGIYLTEISVTQAVQEQETEESIKKRNEWQASKDPKKERTQPAPVRVPVITQTLRLNGIAHVPNGTDTERLQQIILFNNDLTSKPVQLPFNSDQRIFTDGFTDRPEPSAVVGATVDGREVSNFTFTLRSRAQTIH